MHLIEHFSCVISSFLFLMSFSVCCLFIYLCAYLRLYRCFMDNLAWFVIHSPHYITVRPRSRDPFCIVNYCIKWVTTSWTYSSRWILWKYSYVQEDLTRIIKKVTMWTHSISETAVHWSCIKQLRIDYVINLMLIMQ